MHTNHIEQPTCLNNLLSVFTLTTIKRVLSEKRIVHQKKIHLSLNSDNKSKTSRKLTISTSFTSKPTPSTLDLNTEKNIQTQIPPCKPNRGLNFHPRKISFNNQHTNQVLSSNKMTDRIIKSDDVGVDLDSKKMKKEKVVEINKLTDKKAPMISDNENYPFIFNNKPKENHILETPNQIYFSYLNSNQKRDSPNAIDSTKEEDTPETTILEKFKECEDLDEVFKKEEESDVKSKNNGSVNLSQIDEQLLINQTSNQSTSPLATTPLLVQNPIRTIFDQGTVNSQNDESSQRSGSFAFSNVIERINAEEMIKDLEHRLPTSKFSYSEKKALNTNLPERFSLNSEYNNISSTISRLTEVPKNTMDFKNKISEVEETTINFQNTSYKRLQYIEELYINSHKNIQHFEEETANNLEENLIISNSETTGNKVKGVFDQFLKVNYLGVGRFASVYLCYEESLKFIFALKEILTFTIEANQLSNQLKQEIEIQYACSHPHVATLFGAWKDSKKYYLAIEYGQSTLLKKLETEKAINEEICLDYIRQIAEGLEYLHDRGIVHRDIKPENIILVNGVCKITDFGWATRNDLDNLKETCGTPCYISPQIENGEKYTSKTDSWSLGVLAYELVNGKLDEFYFSRGILEREKLKYCENVSWGYRKLVNSLLAPLERDRPSMKELLEEEILHVKCV